MKGFIPMAHPSAASTIPIAGSPAAPNPEMAFQQDAVEARSDSALAGASNPDRTFVLGTRTSKLALGQTDIVRSALCRNHPDHVFTVTGMTTTGDQNQAQALYLIGGKALWTKELELALLEGGVDLIVHSLKDMPTVLPEGCELGAIMEREDPRDALVVRKDLPYRTLEELPDGSVIGTSSVRRVAQLRRQFPRLQFQDIRGNLNTRFAKLDAPDSPYTAIVLAVAGLVRLDFDGRISSYLGPPVLYHAVGQGALGVEVRSSLTGPQASPAARARVERVRTMVRALEHLPTAWACEAERELLRTLEGGCSVPVGVSSRIVTPEDAPPGTSTLTLRGVVTSLDGSKEAIAEETERIRDRSGAVRVGRRLAEELMRTGAREILEELGKIKKEGQEAATKTAVAEVQIPKEVNLAEGPLDPKQCPYFGRTFAW